MSKTDPVRNVLTQLLAESHAPYTTDAILREFHATRERRASNRDLLALLKSISQQRDSCQQVLEQIKETLKRKDPMYALLLFAQQHSDDNLGLQRNMHKAYTDAKDVNYVNSYTSGLDSVSHDLRGALPRVAQDIPTSTPMLSRKPESQSPTQSVVSLGGFFARQAPQVEQNADLSVIKERVLSAVSNSVLSNRSLGPLNADGSLSGGIKTQAKTGSPHVELSAGVPDEYRTHAVWDFLKVISCSVQPKLEGLPLDSQQRVILADLIGSLTGVYGNYIVPLETESKPAGLAKYETTFAVNVEMSKSLHELVKEMTPLASQFVSLQKMVAATNGYSQVNNSLNVAINDLTHDFYLLLAQLEMQLKQNKLTLQKMLYYMRPTISVMEEAWPCLIEVQLSGYYGADTLSHLTACYKKLEGDKPAQDLLIYMTEKAAQPYMHMLQLWIQKGIIVDRYNEFLVEDNDVVSCDDLPEHYSADYWEKRYTVRREQIPTFLEKYSDKILRTGKYLNVIRQCGKRVMATQQMSLHYNPSNDQHISVINDAYCFAARMLLDVLLTENDLMGHLQSVKRYLLLNQGDFTMQFMDACDEELAKNVDQVLPMTLENLLGLTLRLSSARNDPYKDDLHCELLTYDLVTQMSKIMNQKPEYWQMYDRLDLSGLECFAFTYEVKWPVSLVLNHIAISKYQMLFRQLFFCKHVERQLCRIWKENSIAKKFSPHAAELYRSAFTLRQRMMNAVQNLEYYMMIEIIEPNWHIFIEKLKSVKNVDDVLSLHQDFLDSCLKNCMLTESSHLNRGIFKLCKVSLRFCEFIQRSQRWALDAELKSMVCDSCDEISENSFSDKLSLSDEEQEECALQPTDTFGERVKRFDFEFTGLLISFLKQITDLAKENTADRFMNLVHRINFNSFYTDQIEKLCMKAANKTAVLIEENGESCIDSQI